MTELTAKALTEWHRDEGFSYPEEILGKETPFGEFEYVDEYRDYSIYAYIVKHKDTDRNFRWEGSWDSWNGVEWSENYNGWEEVSKKTRVEEYWDTV